VAVFADKCSIDEELVRLESHLNQLRTTLTAQGSIGKKLDFILQEVNREINTIGSKANDIMTTNLVSGNEVGSREDPGANPESCINRKEG